MGYKDLEKRGQMTNEDYKNYTSNELDVIAAAANAAIENGEKNCFNFEDLLEETSLAHGVVARLGKNGLKGVVGSLCNKGVFDKQTGYYWDFQISDRFNDLVCRVLNEY